MDGQPVAGPSGSSERHQEPERQYEYVNGFKFAVDLPSIPTRPTSSVSADPPLSQPVDHAALPATASAHASAVESSLNKSNKSSAETKGKQASKAATATTANGTKVKSNKTRPKKSKAAMAAEAEEKAAREANPEAYPKDKGKGKASAAKSKKSVKDDSTSKKRSKASSKSASARSKRESSAAQESHDPAAGGLMPMGHAYDPDADSEDEEDDREWCICKSRYVPGMLMICCDLCDGWYHPNCLGMDEDDIPLVNSFYCPNCIQTTGKKTTWFARCSRHGCNAAQKALSKFCSDWCGTHVAASKLDKLGFDPMELWDYVASAQQKRQGYVLVHDVDAPAQQTEASFQLPLFSSATPPSAHSKSRKAIKETPSKVELQSALPAFDEEAEERAAHKRTESLQAEIAHTQAQLEAVHTKLGLLERRTQLFQMALKGWESAARDLRASVQAEQTDSNTGKGSKKNNSSSNKAANSVNDAPCSFDERLAWSDEDWREWVQSEKGRLKLEGHGRSEDERGLVCSIPKKRCDRHSGWQKLQESSLDIETIVETRQADKYAGICKVLESQLQTHEEQQAALRSQREARPAGVVVPAVHIVNSPAY